MWRSIDASIFAIKVHDGTLCFEGAGEERSWLAEMVEFLLASISTGLGMAIAKKLMKEMGHKIYVKAEDMEISFILEFKIC